MIKLKTYLDKGSHLFSSLLIKKTEKIMKDVQLQWIEKDTHIKVAEPDSGNRYQLVSVGADRFDLEATIGRKWFTLRNISLEVALDRAEEIEVEAALPE